MTENRDFQLGIKYCCRSKCFKFGYALPQRCVLNLILTQRCGDACENLKHRRSVFQVESRDYAVTKIERLLIDYVGLFVSSLFVFDISFDAICRCHPLTRNSSEDEIANVNFLYDDIVHAVKIQ